MMTKANNITVASKAFVDATNKITKMKRAPRGARSNMPKDTLISRANGKLKIETPVAETLIDYTGDWRAVISVDARLLANNSQSHAQSGSLDITLSDGLQISSVYTAITHKTTVPAIATP
jgi:hypothetical protein